jgi:hypothetical protein
VVRAPYTIVIDNRIEATIVSEADSLIAERIWAKVDVNTIKALEILRGPSARQRYPAATGDVIAVARCYKSGSVAASS